MKLTFTAAPNSPWTQSATPATLSFTRYTATTPTRLSKGFAVGPDGSLDKRPGGNLIDGTAERINTDFAGFADLLQTLQPDNALGFGIAAHARAQVLTRAGYAQAVATCATEDRAIISRTREHFTWPHHTTPDR